MTFNLDLYWGQGHLEQVVVFYAKVRVPFATDTPWLGVQPGGWIG